MSVDSQATLPVRSKEKQSVVTCRIVSLSQFNSIGFIGMKVQKNMPKHKYNHDINKQYKINDIT